MRPDLQYIKDKFSFYNKLCFGGKLPMPPISLNMRYATMGITKSTSYIDAEGVRHTNFSIEISVRLDLPEEEYIDTILHEMIHYYIFVNNIVDDSPHGSIFKHKMKELADLYGLKVTLDFDPSDEMLVKEISHFRYVCVADFNDGKMALAVVARNKLFQFWEIYPKIYRDVANVTWYVSNRAIFGKYPVSVSPSLIGINADTLHHYLQGSKQLVKINDVIRTLDIYGH